MTRFKTAAACEARRASVSLAVRGGPRREPDFLDPAAVEDHGRHRGNPRPVWVYFTKGGLANGLSMQARSFEEKSRRAAPMYQAAADRHTRGPELG